jgi:hypothetical protein
MVDANHHSAGVTLSLAASVPLPPRLTKDGPLYRAIRTAPETHTTVPATLRTPYFVEMLMASTLKKFQILIQNNALDLPHRSGQFLMSCLWNWVCYPAIAAKRNANTGTEGSNAAA